MLIVIFIIFLIVAIIGNQMIKEIPAMIGTLGSILTFAIIFFIMFPYGIDKKITIYEEENIKIEIKVKDTVKSYMNYEQDTYDNLIKDADLTTLIIKYPELNSNELVKQEINTYIENSKQIKELKEKNIDRATLAWWLYFGK